MPNPSSKKTKNKKKPTCDYCSNADRRIAYAPPAPVPFDADNIPNGIKLIADYIAKHDMPTDLAITVQEAETLRAAHKILRRLAGYPEVPVVSLQAHDGSQNIHRILFEFGASLTYAD